MTCCSANASPGNPPLTSVDSPTGAASVPSGTYSAMGTSAASSLGAGGAAAGSRVDLDCLNGQFRIQAACSAYLSMNRSPLM